MRKALLVVLAMTSMAAFGQGVIDGQRFIIFNTKYPSSSLGGSPVGTLLMEPGFDSATDVVLVNGENGNAVSPNFGVTGTELNLLNRLDTLPGPFPLVFDLDMRVIDFDGGNIDTNIEVLVYEDNTGQSGRPFILPDQVRTISSSAPLGTALGLPLQVINSAFNFAVYSQDNSGLLASFGGSIGTNEVTFEVGIGGTISTTRSLEEFFPGRVSGTIELEILANNNFGFHIETVTIWISEGDKPIFEPQTRVVSNLAVGAQLATLVADPAATFWTIEESGLNGEGLFQIDSTGILSFASNIDTSLWGGADSFIYDLDVRGGNASGLGPVGRLRIWVSLTECGYIPPTQVRFTSSLATPETLIGFPIDFHNIDSLWIQEAYVDSNVPGTPPLTDLGSYFGIDSGTDLGQLRVLRPLSNIFDPEAVTKVVLGIRGHAVSIEGSPTNGCIDLVDQDVIIYVLPQDSSDTGGGTDDNIDNGDGNGDGGVDDTLATDFTEFIIDENLLACIQATLGKSPADPIIAEEVVALTRLDCQCRSNNGITNLEGIHLFINLEFLGLANNLITDIEDVVGLNNLVDLRLANNLISDISSGNPLASLRNLEFLDLSNNQITETDALASLSNIFWVSLANNQICDISALEALANLTNGGLEPGDTVLLDNNHLVSAEALSQIGAIQQSGAFISVDDQTACPTTTRAPVSLATFPNDNILEFTNFVNRGAVVPCNTKH